MADLQPTDVLLVNRAGVDYSVPQSDVMADVLDTDLLLVNRAGVDYQASYADVKKGFGPQHIDPAPSDWTFVPGIVSGAGTQADPFIITPETVSAPGGTVESAQTLTLTGLTPNDLVEWTDHSTGAGNRFHQDLGLVPPSGQVDLKLKYLDTPNSTVDAAFTGDLQIGTSYFRWVVTQEVKVAPVIGSVVLTDSPEAGRFTSGTFASAVTMTEDGLPVSTKGLKAWVEGALKAAAVSSAITKVTATPGPTATMHGLRFNTARKTKLTRAGSGTGTFSCWAKSSATGTQTVATGVTHSFTSVGKWEHVFSSSATCPSSIGDQFNGYISDVYFVEAQTLSAGDFTKTFGGTLGPLDSAVIKAGITTGGGFGANGFYLPFDPAAKGTRASVDILGDPSKSDGPTANLFDGDPSTIYGWAGYPQNQPKTDVFQINFGIPITGAFAFTINTNTGATLFYESSGGETGSVSGSNGVVQTTSAFNVVNSSSIKFSVQTTTHHGGFNMRKITINGSTYFGGYNSIGVDDSGKGNNFTDQNFVLTGSGPDTVTDTPVKNYATLLTGKNGNLVASAAGTDLTYKGQSGINYYYEEDGAGKSHPGGSAFASVNGKTYNFGQQLFAGTQTPGTQTLVQDFVGSVDLELTDNTNLSGFTVGDAVTEVGNGDDGTGVVAAVDAVAVPPTMSLKPAGGTWDVGSAVKGPLKTQITKPKTSAITNVAGNVLTLTDNTNLANFRVGDVVQTQGTGNTAWNETQAWSSGTTVSSNVSDSVSRVFDGSLTTVIGSPSANGSTTFSVDFNNILDSITVTKLELAWKTSDYGSQTGEGLRFTVNNNSSTKTAVSFAPNLSTGTWVTVSNPPSTLSSIQVFSNFTGDSTGLLLAAIRINDKILVDGSVVKVAAIDSAAPSIPPDGGSWSGTDGTSSGTLADREAFVTGPPKPAANVKLYTVHNAAGAVSDLQSADPGYVIMAGNSPYTLTWPATMPSGNAPDVDLPAGTTLTTEIQATSAGSTAVTKTSNIVNPA